MPDPSNSIDIVSSRKYMASRLIAATSCKFPFFLQWQSITAYKKILRYRTKESLKNNCRILRPNGVVPLTVEVLPRYLQESHFLVADFLLCRVEVVVQFRFHF
jgi:hypothetical protein